MDEILTNMPTNPQEKTTQLLASIKVCHVFLLKSHINSKQNFVEHILWVSKINILYPLLLPSTSYLLQFTTSKYLYLDIHLPSFLKF